MDEQAVVNSDPGIPTGEDVGAQDELDFLAQYEEGHKPKVEPQNDDKVLVEWARSQMQKTQQIEEKEGINASVKAIKSELDGINASDRIIRGLLHDFANQNPKVGQAFANREQDPATWNRVLKAAAKEFRNEFENAPDPKMTEDRNVVESAVHSASTSKPVQDEKVDFAGMNRAQLDAYLRGQG